MSHSRLLDIETRSTSPQVFLHKEFNLPREDAEGVEKSPHLRSMKFQELGVSSGYFMKGQSFVVAAQPESE